MAEETETKGGVVATQDNTIPVETLYYFDVVNTHSLTLQNQITDNWLEDNTVVNDHIAKQPLTIILSGLRGELVYKYDEQQAEQLLQESRTYSLKYNKAPDLYNASENYDSAVFNIVSEKLTAISYLIPSSSNITQLAKNVYDYSNASFNRYRSIFNKLFGTSFGMSNEEEQSLISNIQPPDDTKLKEIYRNFSTLRKDNKPLTVSTPYGEFSGMYIQSLTLRQDGENFITDIELTLKQLRFANVQVTAPDTNIVATYRAQAQADIQNNGNAQGSTVLYNTFTPNVEPKIYDKNGTFIGN